ncbi:MAG: NADP-dependent isocitrate dehydrogenase, partial [bacterium]
MSQSPPIIYTWTDEAPALATHAFLPIIRAFAGATGVPVETRDISLAGRLLAVFPDRLKPEQREADGLAELGGLVKTPEANVIKLPNVSASVPQMKDAIAELQAKGYALPDYPDEPSNDDERQIKTTYDSVKGSAVNPVLREGNSDRRAPNAVKEYARQNPHRMGKWSDDSKTHVSTMSAGDFRHNEKSITVADATSVNIVHTASDGTKTVLKEAIPLLADEVIDATRMSKKALVSFLAEQIEDSAAKDVLFSLHMKATMMKVSDPIIFGHAVKVFYASVFEKHAATLDRLGVNVKNGFGDLEEKIATLPDAERAAIKSDIKACYAARPPMAMVNS